MLSPSPNRCRWSNIGPRDTFLSHGNPKTLPSYRTGTFHVLLTFHYWLDLPPNNMLVIVRSNWRRKTTGDAPLIRKKRISAYLGILTWWQWAIRSWTSETKLGQRGRLIPWFEVRSIKTGITVQLLPLLHSFNSDETRPSFTHLRPAS